MRWLLAALLLSLAAPVVSAQAPGPEIASEPVAPLRTHPALQDAPVSVLTPPVDAKCPEWWPLSIYAGFNTDEARIVDTILYRESRCDYNAFNRQDPNGGSRGLMQVNGSWTKWLRDKGILDKVEDLFEPAVNLAATRAIYEYGVAKHGWGWAPWGMKP